MHPCFDNELFQRLARYPKRAIAALEASFGAAEIQHTRTILKLVDDCFRMQTENLPHLCWG